MKFDPVSEAFFDDPMPVYAWLRDESPVHYLEEFDAFFLSRFQDVWDATSDTRMSGRFGTTSNELLLGQKMNPGINLGRLDPPRHTHMRNALLRDFLPGAARRLELHMRRQAREYLAELAPRGEFDVIGDYSMRLTVNVACFILGVPFEDAKFLAESVKAFFSRESGTRGQTEAGKSATSALWDYLGCWIEERRRSGEQKDDILGRLLAFEDEGWRLEKGDLVSMLQLIVVGSTETLPKAFAGAVNQLSQHPDQRAEITANKELVPDAFWEALRTEMPTQMLGRTVIEATEHAGQRFEPGQKVLFLWASANRDGREFLDADRFDIHRRAPRILSFGQAVHRCLGHNIARLEGQILLEELLGRIPEYTVEHEHSVRIRSEFFRGFSALPISFNPC
jgi:cytochrome P450